MKKIIFLLIAMPFVLAHEQSVRITGTLLCHGKPSQYTELQLVSKKIIGGDAFARNVFTDPSGQFEIAGYINARFWGDISARLYIWHVCFPKPAEQANGCTNWFEIEVPRVYVTEGPLAEKTWNLGEIPLEERQSGQQLIC